MDEIVQLVAKKTGLPKETAKVAVETVINYLKKKLPKPIGAQIDGLLKGAKASDIESAVSGLTNLLGQATKAKKKK